MIVYCIFREKEPEKERSFFFTIKLLIHAQRGCIDYTDGKESRVHLIRKGIVVIGQRSDVVVSWSGGNCEEREVEKKEEGEEGCLRIHYYYIRNEEECLEEEILRQGEEKAKIKASEEIKRTRTR